MLAAGSSSRAGLLRRTAEPAPSDAVYEPWWRAGLQAALPSTVGLGVLGGIALSFSTALAAVIGGVLAGMGLLALVSGLLLWLQERETGRRVYANEGGERRFVGP